MNDDEWWWFDLYSFSENDVNIIIRLKFKTARYGSNQNKNLYKKYIFHLITLPMLHFTLGTSHVLLYFLNLVLDVSDFIFAGSLLLILSSREIKL